MGKPVLVMWDYEAFPIWADDDVDVALPAELESALQAWSDEGTRHFIDEDAPGTWKADWADRGRALAQRVATHLGPVDFKNEATLRTERIG
jgi:hypothetical protein